MEFTEEKPKKVTEYAPIRKVTMDGNWLFIVLFVLIILCAVLTSVTAYNYFQWRSFSENVQHKVNSEFTESKNFIGSNVRAFDERLENLEKLVEPFSILNPENTINSAIERTNDELFARNEKVVAELRGEMDSLKEDLKITKARVEESTRREIIFVSLLNLKQKIDSSLPFAAELEIALSVSADNKEIIDELLLLKDAADIGLESFAGLKEKFTRIATSMVKKDKMVVEDTAFQKIINNILSSVTVRKVGMIEGQNLEAVVARAEENLAKGNLENALLELEKVNTDDEEFNDWLRNARNLSSVEGIFIRIVKHITNNNVERNLSRLTHDDEADSSEKKSPEKPS